MVTFCVELYAPPSSEFASKLLFNIDAILDVYFAKRKNLHEMGSVQVICLIREF